MTISVKKQKRKNRNLITVIGNGESRKNINIDKINGIKIGCNAIYLHEKVDYVCAVDKFWRDKVSKECSIPLISRYHNNAFQTTLEMFKEGKWLNTDVLYRGYCSGITALDFISTKGNEIYLIGFDFGYTGSTVNHIYKGTPNHPPADYPAQHDAIFLTQCLETIKRYPKNKYYWVSDSDFLIKMKPRNLEKISIQEYIGACYEKIFR